VLPQFINLFFPN